jgi:c-di-GMP-binding flagellar brake protein YcgR
MKVRYRLPRCDKAEVGARTVDLGLGGVRLSVSRQIPAGEQIEVVFRDDANGNGLSLVGSVVWAVSNEAAHTYEVGVQFPGLSQAQRQTALKLMGLNGHDDGMERRRFARVRRNLTVDLRETLLARRVLSSVLDIGLGGMAVEAAKEFKAEAICSADVLLPGSSQPARLRARVLSVRPRDDGQRWFMRMRFEVFEGDAREALARFLAHALSRPGG